MAICSPSRSSSGSASWRSALTTTHIRRRKWFPSNSRLLRCDAGCSCAQCTMCPRSVPPPGRNARPLHLDDAIKHFLVPSWSPSGELLVRALQTGVVSRIALDTGKLTPIAKLAATPLSQLFDDRLMTLANGDLLAVNNDLGTDV